MLPSKLMYPFVPVCVQRMEDEDGVSLQPDDTDTNCE